MSDRFSGTVLPKLSFKKAVKLLLYIFREDMTMRQLFQMITGGLSGGSN